MKKQRGYTVVEALFLLIILTCLAGTGIAIYVLSHFIGKFW